MAKREKIIIVLMVAAILYGVYNFFLTSPPETTTEVSEVMGIEALNKFVVGAAQELFSEKSADVDSYIISQAQAEWTHDPFYLSATSISAQKAAKDVAAGAQKEVRLAYTGFIEVANKRMAIINDLEYETGEALNQPGYYVKLITPKRVVLGIEGEIENVILPLEEQ